MAKTKRPGSKPNTSALVGTAFSHRELLVMAASIKLAEKSDFKARDRAALNRIFVKLEKAHVWQMQQRKARKSARG